MKLLILSDFRQAGGRQPDRYKGLEYEKNSLLVSPLLSGRSRPVRVVRKGGNRRNISQV